MNNQWLLGVALCAAALGAQAQQGDESVTIPAPGLTIDQPVRLYYIGPSEIQEFRGVYELADGRLMHLTGSGTTIYAEVEGHGQHRMVATQRNTFVAQDRQLQVRLDLRRDGGVGGEVLMVVPERIAATGETVDRVIRLATR